MPTEITRRAEDPESGAAPKAPLDAGRASVGPGRRLGRYVVLRALGAGGMGVVYAAYDPDLDRNVALKVLRTDQRHGGARLVREAQALARLSHPNVVTVHDVGMLDDDVFIAMELLDGPTLREWLASAPRSWQEVLAVFLPAGRGLAAAHAAGLIHRDFKPDNVLMGKGGIIRVTDFGVARLADEAPHPTGAGHLPDAGVAHAAALLGTPLTRAGAVVGTPAYMAPEQHLAGPTDPRTDQFSFCASLYLGLYGMPAFAGRSSEALVSAVRAGQLSPPPEGTRVPAWLRRAVARGLNARIEDRYPSMLELLSALSDDPARRRRRTLGFLGLFLALGLGGGALWHQARNQRLQCKGAERKLLGIWDPERARSMRAAFALTGLAEAQRTSAQAEQALDGYARDWARSHTDACEAAQLRGEQSLDVLDLRMSCLEARRQELGALTTALAQADPKTVKRSLEAAAALTPLADCADVEALKRPIREPKEASVRARIQAVRGQLAEAKVAQQIGKYAIGEKAAEAAARQAEAIGYRPLEAQAYQRLGNLQFYTADKALALGTYARAERAADAGHDDETRATALLYAMALFTYLGKYEDSRRVNERLTPVLERLGRPEALVARQLHAEGDLLRWLGKIRQAVEKLKAALALSRALPAPVRADVLSTLAFAQAGLGDCAGALESARSMVELLAAARGAQHPKTALAERDLALVGLGCGTDPGPAAAALRAALPRLVAGFGEGSVQTSLAQVALGQIAIEQGQEALAQRELERAADALGKGVGAMTGEQSEALIALAKLARLQGHGQEALQLSRRALAAAEKAVGPDDPYDASSLVSMAEAELALGHGQAAIPRLEKALRLLGDEGDIGTRADARFALSRALLATGGDAQRARRLARQARDGYLLAPGLRGRELKEVTALAER